MRLYCKFARIKKLNEIVYINYFCRKYSISEKLVTLVTDTVDYTIDNMVKREGLNTPFNPINHIYSIFLNIMSMSAFGKRYYFIQIIKTRSQRKIFPGMAKGGIPETLLESKIFQIL